MAKIKWGMMVVDGRGKLGGHVLSKNRAGSYTRTKVTPVNPQTSRQSAVRSLFGAISQQWSGLSESERNGWNASVAEWQKTDIFGDLKQPSGKALFQRLNNQAQVAGYPPVLNAPAKLNMVDGVVESIVYDDANLGEIVLTGNYAGADARIMLFATPVLSPGTTFVKNRLRLLYTSLANAYNGADAYSEYQDKFGFPSNNDNVYFAIKYVLPNGQASPLQILKGGVIV